MKDTNNFCGVRVVKLKNIGDMIAMEMHGLRDKNMTFGDNIDASRTCFNQITRYNNFENVKKTYYSCLSRTSGTVRKDHIKCLEYVFYRSDCLDTPEELDKFKNSVHNFCKNYFKDCPYMICEHVDEGVQHFHVIVIPNGLKDDKYKFIGSDFVGKKQKLIDLQTDFSNYCSSVGLVRGVSQYNKDKHIKLKDYYEEEHKKQIEEYEKIIKHNELVLEQNKQLLDENIKKNEYLESVNSGLDAEINKYKNVDKDEKIEKFQKSIFEFISVLEEYINDPDYSEHTEIFRFCLKLLKSILVKYNLIRIEKNDIKHDR